MVNPCRFKSAALLRAWPLLLALIAAVGSSLPDLSQSSHERDTIVVIPTPTPTIKLPQVGLGVDQTSVSPPIKDATGELWAVEYSRYGALFKWDGKTWRRQSFKPAEGASLDAFTRGSDGSVLCLWNFNSFEKPVKDLLLSRHQGSNNRVLARWKANVNGDVRVFPLKHATWVTGNGTQIYRVQNGSARCVYTIARREMYSGYPHTEDDYNNALRAVEDNRGHTYFWTNELDRGYRNLSLRGVLKYDGHRWIPHSHITGIPDKPYTAFVVRTPHTFWLAVGEMGLFELDTLTWTGKRLADPMPYAFEGVQKIEQVGGVWYVVSDAPEVRYPRGDYSQRQSDLWRWQDSPTSSHSSDRGHFERILHGLDYGGYFSTRADRPLLATSTGLWIGAISGGAWWMPFDKKHPPVHLDWRRGLLQSDIVGLTRQNDGHVMASSWGITVPDLRAYLNVTPTKTACFTAYGSIIEDVRHHLWRVPDLKERNICEWDGHFWRPYAVPTSYRLSSLFYLSADTRGRIWLLPDDTSETVALLQPTTGTWQFFPSFSQALQRQLHDLGAKESADLHIGSGNYFVTSFAAGNRMAFRAPNEKVFFFDGRQWRNWTLNAITGQKRLTAQSWDERPYFTPSGTLSVNIIGKTWYWLPPRGWKSGFDREFPVQPTPIPTPPPGSNISNPNSTVRDSSGAIWMTKDRQLYKAAWGLCEPQLAPHERHPLRDGRGLGAVLLDPRGTPLLTTSDEDNYEYIWAPQSFPDTRVQVEHSTGDTFRLRFTALPENQPKHWFRWRLDNGQWSAPQKVPTLSLDFVPAGTHRFEVATINSRLELDPSPATTTLQVAIASQEQLSKLLSMLDSPDYARREKAVNAFAKQPERALPFLRAARRNANTDLRWWIEAAIQEIERQTTPQ
ncbi:hypothetical protein IAD21_05188 [Abditibacteriota bacterium]|nr:hypothetical protein IAD21_05188 [Abditibacteriota bacterium]